MSKRFNLPIKGFDQTEKGNYVPKSGAVLTGDLEFPITGYIMKSDNKRWRVTVNDSGNLITTEIATGDPGYPYGLSLGVTLTSI